MPLSQVHQFIVCKFTPKENGKSDKIPINPETMFNADAHDSKVWMSADDAILYASTLGDDFGVGFVFTENDPFWFLDLDSCITDSGEYTPIALDMIRWWLPNAAVEVSHSNKGLHIIGSGACPQHGTRNKEHGMEFYTEKRFVALTGNVLQGVASAAEPRLAEMVGRYFPLPAATNGTSLDWTTGPCADSSPIEDDDQLIAKMIVSQAAAGAFSGKCTPADLWHANVTVLSQTYPDPERDYDASAADMALASHLAFWTGKNCERIERLMRRSALMREKWDRRERGTGYLRDTILKAVSGCSETFGVATPSETNGAPPPPPTSDTIEIETRSGYQLLTPENQREYFKNMVYIQDQHKIWVPSGQFLKPEQFKATYGGYNFALDAMGDKITKNAWEAITESQALRFPKVNTSAFRPLMSPAEVFDEEGIRMVNSYVPINTARREGNATPFLDLMKRMLPDDRDREILMCFMAAVVQYPGVKFQFIPLIQGAEGNGKTLLAHVVAFSVGWRYSHLPNAPDLGSNGLKFNKWMMNKLFIGLEEIYTDDRHHLVDAMKIMTNTKMEIQGKAADQVMADTPFNTMALTNHQDAMRITLDQRRWAVFWCAQQSAADLKRDNMTEAYFRDMYNWLRAEGFEIMNDYLRKYQIVDEFNPATHCYRAPMTTSTPHAVVATRGGVEQEIMDAIEEDRTGFAGGWVSTIMLSRLLEQMKVANKIPRNKRRDIMRSLGYDWHPGLPNGRVNNPISQEGGKPKLFSKIGHLNNNIGTPAEVVKAYCKAQGYVNSTVDSTVTNE